MTNKLSDSPTKAQQRKIAELFSLCREMKGLTLRQVEKETGFSNAFISQLERGVANMGFYSAVKLCDYYGIKLDRIANILRGKHD